MDETAFERHLFQPSAEAEVLMPAFSIADLDNATFAWRRAGFDVRTLRGWMMRTPAAAYDELAAVFQFPLYFGHNLMAVEDLLTDLEWTSPGRGWIVPIVQPELLLVDDPYVDEDFPLFARVFMEAKRYWAGAIRYDNSPATPNLTFSVVLAASGEPDRVARRWSDAGARVIRTGPPMH